MNKRVLTKIAMDEIDELLNRLVLKPNEAEQVLFRGAFIRLFDTDAFKEEVEKREVQVKYYRIFGNKVLYFRTFIYNFPSSGQTTLGKYSYDYPSVSCQIIRPTMDLENLLKDFKEI